MVKQGRWAFSPAHGLRAAALAVLRSFLRSPAPWSVLLLIQSLCFSASAASYVELRVTGVINPVKERYVRNALSRAHAARADFVLISIDTPGGLVSSMQEIIQLITNAELPVVGVVEPSSAQATSAGALILLATDIAAMAPGTRVGAAHPVAAGKALEGVLDEKATNSLASLSRSLAERRGRPLAPAEAMVRNSRSFTHDEALREGLIEIVAADRAELLAALHERALSMQGRTLRLDTRGITRIEVAPSWTEELLDRIADPTLASLLMTLGVLGILYEFSSPGVGLGGVAGALSLLIGLFALSVLPIELSGVLLLVVGLSAIALEIKLPTHGLLAAGGGLALLLGALLLVDSGDYFGAVQRVDLLIFAPAAALAAGLLLLLGRVTQRALAAPPLMGREALVGQAGVAKSDFSKAGQQFSGTVFVAGARFQALAEQPVRAGERIIVLSLLSNPLRLSVRSAGDQ